MGRQIQQAFRVWYVYSVVFLDRNARRYERKCIPCSIAPRDPQISPKVSISAMLKIHRRSQQVQDHVPCSPGRANAPSTQAVLFESRYPGVPPRPRPRSAHPKSAPLPKGIQRRSALDTHNSQILKRSRRLDILQRLLQLPQLPIHSPLGLLRALDSLHLKRLNGLDLPSHIVSGRLERLEVSLDLVDDGRVVESAAVVLEVDGLGLRAEQVQFAARVIVALLEGLEGRCRLPFETERGGDFGPVEFQGGGALGWVLVGSRACLDQARWW